MRFSSFLLAFLILSNFSANFEQIGAENEVVQFDRENANSKESIVKDDFLDNFDELGESKSTVCTEKILLKHIAQNILKSGIKESNSSEQLIFHLSANAKRILSDFANDVPLTHSVDVADSIKDSFFAHQEIKKNFDSQSSFNFQEYHENLQGILMTALLAILLAYTSAYLAIDWRKLAKRVFIVVLIVSIPWNWLLLYKKAVAKKQAQLIERVSEDCREVKVTLSMWLKSVFSIQTQTPCQKYHEALLVDPLWEIAPTQAISETVIRLFVQPSEQLGRAISLCLRSLFEDLPVHLWPFALGFLFCIVFFLLLVTFRYSCRLPLLGGLEPAGNYQLKNYETRLDELQMTLHRLQHHQIDFEQRVALNYRKNDDLTPNRGSLSHEHIKPKLNGKSVKIKKEAVLVKNQDDDCNDDFKTESS